MIETERLRVQALTLEEAAVLADSVEGEARRAWAEGYPTPGSRRAAAGLAEEASESRAASGFGIHQMVRKSDGIVVGDIGFHGAPTASGEVELGFSVACSCRREGLASEALLAMVAWLATQPNVRHIVARTDTDNIASQTVLFRAGFRRSAREDDLFEYVPDTLGAL